MKRNCTKKMIYLMALEYIFCKNISYKKLSEKYQISKTRIHRAFVEELPNMSKFVHKCVMRKASKNTFRFKKKYFKVIK